MQARPLAIPARRPRFLPALSHSHTLVVGVWGLGPHVYRSPCPSTPMPTDCPMSTIALAPPPLAISARRTRFLPALSHSHALVVGVWGLGSHVYHSPLPFRPYANRLPSWLPKRLFPSRLSVFA